MIAVSLSFDRNRQRIGRLPLATKPNPKREHKGIDLSSLQLFATIEDVECPLTTTMLDVYRETVRDKHRLCCDLDGVPFPVLLGEGSIRRLFKAFGPQTVDWIGKSVVLEHAEFLKDGETITYLALKPV